MAVEPIGLMEPMLPAIGNKELEDLAMELAKKGSALANTLHPVVRHSIGDLVRSMNCYYSNLIEGHDTHPRDIDKALAGDFSKDPRLCNLAKPVTSEKVKSSWANTFLHWQKI